MSAPDGYRVTLECGHTETWSTRPVGDARQQCWICGERVEVIWVRVLSRVPGLTWLVDAISGPWTGGDDGRE